MDINRIKVLVADSAPIFAFGLSQALSTGERIEVIGQAYDGQEVIDKTDKLRPDIVVMDLNLSGLDGIKVTEILREIHPEVKVIVLAPLENSENFLEDVIAAGAKGFLSKNVSTVELVKGIIATADIGAAISPTMIPSLMAKMAKLSEGGAEKQEVRILLSAREREIIELVAAGMGNHEIAETLFISENTVKGHIRRITDKLKVNNRVEVARYVILSGLPVHKKTR